MSRRRADELVAWLGLEPHPEGGAFAEVFRSSRRVSVGGSERSALTTIYYLLREGDVSRWHVVASDEVWHLYEGDGLELVTYDPRAEALECVTLSRISDSERAVHAVPAGLWQAARPLGDYVLAGCTVGPGFEYEDFRFVADLPVHQPAFDGPLAAFRDLL